MAFVIVHIFVGLGQVVLNYLLGFDISVERQLASLAKSDAFTILQTIEIMADKNSFSSEVDRRHIPPEFGWRVRLDHNFPDKPKASVIPRWHQVPKLIGMAYRYSEVQCD